MRKLPLYLFLFTYTTVMFKPVMPYFTDAISHVLFFKDHMLTVHAHNGKFHVHAEVAEAAKEDPSSKSTDAIKKNFLSDEYLFTEIYIFPIVRASMARPVQLTYFSKQAFINHHFPPPRC